MKMKWQLLTIIAILSLLITTVVVFLLIYEREVPTSTEDWWVDIVNGTGKTRLSMSELRELPGLERDVSLKGTGEDGKDHTYRGVPLSYILDRWGNNKTSIVKVKAVDYYSYRLSSGDIRDTDSIMLAYEMDGKPIEGGEDGGVGPVRLLIPASVAGEFNAQYCVKFVFLVELE